MLSEIAVELINEAIDSNESLFKQIEFNEEKDISEKIIFAILWQINVRWKSFSILARAQHDTGVNIILRSIYELQKNLEFILINPEQTKQKTLAFKLQVLIQELKAEIGINNTKVNRSLSLTKIINFWNLDEILNLVLSKFEDEKWRKFNWYFLFSKTDNFSAMTRVLNPESSKYSDYVFQNLSLDVHGSSLKIENLITIENPFYEELSRKTLIYIFTLISDFDIIIDLFIKSYYPNLLEQLNSNGRNHLTVTTLIKVLANQNTNPDNLTNELEQELKKMEKNIMEK